MNFRSCRYIYIGLLFCFIGSLSAKEKQNHQDQDTVINASLVSGLKFRSIGPAFTSGRISDFAVNPNNFSEFYVAVASGNIWKTENAGITFEPVFDGYGSYSIGCLAIDPNNTNTIWAGTGENNHQRALGYGDGVYLSLDGGKSWTNMGLKESRQIGMIYIHPENSNIVYVAAEGSVWGPGGERGLYKTIDQGKTWDKVLEVSTHTGINNIVGDPRDPNTLYATSEQRRRHVHTKIGGGPESAIYKSTDGGENWKKLSSGLPTEHMGGIGIAISPMQPDVLYAIIEAANDASGFFRSSDRGESWVKMSNHSSSGQYYTEIYCDPVEFDKVYSTETFSHYTLDGGKTWGKLGTKDRHVDDHALWINPKDNKQLMIGGDGGVYMSYDAGINWRQVSNLPITQFYRVSVDNSTPFYNVYGGTQDNATLGGPSQNTSSFGVTSGEWYVTVFGDGFWSCSDPSNPNIVYSEWQYGNVVRYDKLSGEKIMIKPQPKVDEESFRWNWNAPLILSKHNSDRLYIAANKLFRSDDKGDTWEEISEDLTAQIDRNTWPVMDKYWSSDAVVKDMSSSQYGTIVSLAESPISKDILFVGTDDGLIQSTIDGGMNWLKTDSFTEVPKYTYVSDILASKHDENVVYASFDNMKNDDFTPYLLKSNDKGKTWESIASNLPGNGTIHTITQDHINKDLLFVGTEFGIFFTINEGANWVALKSGLPTIAVKDIAIQERENDLVLATFGRGFYILDNYSSLRKLSAEFVEKDIHLFEPEDALIYMQTGKIYGQGATYFGAKNPEYGATFDLYIKDIPKTSKQKRHEAEKELFKEGKPIPQLSWKALEVEDKEIPPYAVVTIFDEDDTAIRNISINPKQGIQRIAWDLQYAPINGKNNAKSFDPLAKASGHVYVMPGHYSVSVSLIHNNQTVYSSQKQSFEVLPLNNTTIPASNRTEMVAFQRKVSELTKSIRSLEMYKNDLQGEVLAIKQVLLQMPNASPELMNRAIETENKLNDIDFIMNGVQAKASWEEIPPAKMPINVILDELVWAQINSTSNITSTSKASYEILSNKYPEIYESLKNVADSDFTFLRKQLNELNAPYTPNRLPNK